MKLGQIILFVHPGGEVISNMEAAGFVEAHRSIHPGQGTASVSYGLGDLVVELMWMTSADEAAVSPLSRCQIVDRFNWSANQSCPFGLGWRSDQKPPFKTWTYRPSFLPLAQSLAVAQESDHADQPLMWGMPSAPPPSMLVRAGSSSSLYSEGVAQTTIEALEWPEDLPISQTLKTLSRQVGFKLTTSYDDEYRIILSLKDITGMQIGRLSLPECQFLGSVSMRMTGA